MENNFDKYLDKNNEVATPNTNAVATKKDNITDKVLNSVNKMTQEQGLVLPKNYNASNALKAAYLKLVDGNLLNTDQTALAQALLNMCVQGLNPAKNQCYFINYGGKVNMMRSYFGDRAVCIASGLVKDIEAHIIYEGDTVDITYDDETGYINVKHSTSWVNMNNAITGAYAMAIMPDGTKRYDIMTIDRIRKSWAMSKNSGDKNKLQNTFDDDACKRTVIRHLTKNIFNQSTDDNLIIDSYCETTNSEYDYIDAKAATNNVEKHQQKTMGSVKVEKVDSNTGEINLEEAPAKEEFNYGI